MAGLSVDMPVPEPWRGAHARFNSFKTVYSKYVEEAPARVLHCASNLANWHSAESKRP
jgi:hypothetical protein